MQAGRWTKTENEVDQRAREAPGSSASVTVVDEFIARF